MAAVPDIRRQLIGDRFRISLILGPGRHHDDAAAGDIAVMADIADMPGTALNPRILFQFIHIPVD